MTVFQTWRKSEMIRCMPLGEFVRGLGRESESEVVFEASGGCLECV